MTRVFLCASSIVLQSPTFRRLLMIFRYLWLYLIVLKSFLVYISDIFSAVTMLTTKNWSNEIFKQCQDIKGCVFIPFTTGKWLFVSCILVGFLLASRLRSLLDNIRSLFILQLAYESRKARIIIKSNDISSTFTNVLAHDYYSLSEFIHISWYPIQQLYVSYRVL
jgi:hypothetical protein